MSLAREARQQWRDGKLTVPESVYLVALGMPSSDERDLLLDLAVAAEMAEPKRDERATRARRQTSEARRLGLDVVAEAFDEVSRT